MAGLNIVGRQVGYYGIILRLNMLKLACKLYGYMGKGSYIMMLVHGAFPESVLEQV